MSEPDTNKSEIRDGQRIAKAMARAGLCSRRDAEAWIEAGRVSVNGAILDSPAFNVGPDDDVRVDGEPLRAPERTRLFFFHKPRGLVTTARDPEGRRTIFDALPKDLPRVVAIVVPRANLTPSNCFATRIPAKKSDIIPTVCRRSGKVLSQVEA